MSWIGTFLDRWQRRKQPQAADAPARARHIAPKHRADPQKKRQRKIRQASQRRNR